jgi:hypothetical protein
VDKFDVFAEKLEQELLWRFKVCEDHSATPSSIILCVLNAVVEARKEVEKLNTLA